MKKVSSLSAAVLVALGTATPALAHDGGSHAVVILTPGASRSWVQQMPTSFLNTTMAQVMPNGQAYFVTGAAVGGLAVGAAPIGAIGAGLPTLGTNLNYLRGLSNDSEFALGVGLGVTPVFGAGVGAAYKQQLVRGTTNAVAFNVGAYVNNIGAATGTNVGALVGLPITFDVGVGHLTIDPRLNIGSIGNFNTAATAAEAAVGLEFPFADRWTALIDATPGYQLNNGGFRLPVGLGARFSPTATSHVDFTVLQAGLAPFGGASGLLGATGYIGF